MKVSSKVISKLRCYSPSLKSTPIGNIKHFFYISDRNNAMRNKLGKSEFGYISNGISNNIKNMNSKDIAKYIKNKSSLKTNIYRGIISLRENDALSLGYKSKKQWEFMLKENIREIADIVNIPFSRLEYVGVIHNKKGNPHIHYMFWDKNQAINDCFITPEQQNKIRDILTKNIYGNELKELYYEKDQLKKNVKPIDMLLAMKSYDLSTCNEKIPYIKMKNKNRKELIKQFKMISNKLPEKGRLYYSFMSDDIKQDLNNLVDKLYESNFDMKISYDNYFEKVNEISDYFSDDYKDEIKIKETNRIYSLLGNELLRVMKEYKSVMAENILFNLYSLMSRLEDQEDARANSKEFINSLSINAKKEYARIMNYSIEDLER